VAHWKLSDLAAKMRKIDFTMLFTRTEGGSLAGRPMSNNGEVDYEGDSWFFAFQDTRAVADIERDPEVGLSLQGAAGLLGKPPLFVAVEGRATILRDKAEFARRWHAGLERWFPKGIDTPDLVLIRVHARRIHYWSGEDEGELTLS
jgi:general stress protein 26